MLTFQDASVSGVHELCESKSGRKETGYNIYVR